MESDVECGLIRVLVGYGGLGEGMNERAEEGGGECEMRVRRGGEERTVDDCHGEGKVVREKKKKLKNGT